MFSSKLIEGYKPLREYDRKVLRPRNIVINIVTVVETKQQGNANRLITWKYVPIEILNFAQDLIQTTVTLAFCHGTDIIDQ